MLEKVSIIVPVYNTANYLDECIESVLMQTYHNIEIILVDDGSTDESPAICDRYAAQDPRIRCIHKPNRGAADSRNVGMSAALGTWILFLDSDDYYSQPDLIDRLLYAASLKKWDVVCFNYRRVSDDGHKSSPLCSAADETEDLSALIRDNSYTSSACIKFIRRDLLLDNHISFIRGIVGEDIPWVLEVLLSAKHMGFLSDPIYNYRVRADSVTNSVSEKHVRNLLYAVKRCEELSQAKDSPLREIGLAYTAFQYCTLLVNLNKAHLSRAHELKREVYAMSYLLDNQGNRIAELVAFVRKILGIRFTGRLLYWYVLLTD